ncbi:MULTISPECIES: diguanylate cyclase domain-containing protein [unclassified Brevundimonas]|uniref:diguanylate cyclase domain-containing protein n=1 Tax=unclassified Brevundimonas TaxID=2622653 RepID=UPI0006F6672E|nr:MULTISPECIES: diguanylate cyclase [unclassified Brevundimonas]KQY64941.1 response regulator [Brevundimonas sp. Root1423]KRA26923.1 response regulator [Brevundimonas sp. Root608]
MGSDPRILVVAPDDDLVGPLCQGLDALGWRTVTARSLAGAVQTLIDWPLEAVLLDARLPNAADGVEALRQTVSPRRLPVLAIGPETPSWESGLADIAMSNPPHAAQAALRLENLIRSAIAEEEVSLREATFAARGQPLPPTDVDATPLRVLAAGKPDRHFLALSNALTERGCEVVAAPTPYTAFDYLHEKPFDAAVLWGAEDHAPALSIASGMKRNTRLYHIPAVLYLRGAGEINLAELYNRGFADVAAADTPEDETAERIATLARAHRRHVAIRKALESARGSGLTDPATGLFTPQLFASHLARVAEGARLRRRPLSVAVLRVSETEAVVEARKGGWLDRALPQIGAMVSRLIRTEDTAARLSPDVFALALPATHGPSARIAADRIAAVIGCTAFDAGPDRSPFVVEFEVGVAEIEPDESPAAVLERASKDVRSQA